VVQIQVTVSLDGWGMGGGDIVIALVERDHEVLFTFFGVICLSSKFCYISIIKI